MASPAAPARPRNDPAQYDDLADEWWQPRGPFAMLHWIAAARAQLVPRATRRGSVLVDVACGGGLLGPHVAGLGHRHVGLDLSAQAALTAQEHGVTALRADALALPFADGIADVVVAGEVLEHVTDLRRAVAELTRVLRPGGSLVIDTLADTAWARFTAISVGERMPGGPPPLLHEPAMFVDRAELVSECARHGVPLSLRGLRPALFSYLGWLAGRRSDVRMVPSRLTAGLFQAYGVKAAS